MCFAVIWYNMILWSCITSKSLCILAYTSKQHNAAIIHYETPEKRVQYNFKKNHTRTTLRSTFNWIAKYNIFANNLLHDLWPPCNFMIDLFDCLPVCLCASVYLCLCVLVCLKQHQCDERHYTHHRNRLLVICRTLLTSIT